MKFVTLEKFRRRKQMTGEALSLFIHDLKKLLDRAMPDIVAIAQEQLLLHQFLTGLPAAVGRQSRLLLALDDQKSTTAVTTENSQLKELKGQVMELTEQVAALMTRHHVKKQSTSVLQQRDVSAANSLDTSSVIVLIIGE